jgi:hypothetical protein
MGALPGRCDVKTEGSVAPIPLSEFACAVLQAWQKVLGSRSPYIFPSPKSADRPISTVKTAWKGTLSRRVALFDLHSAARFLNPIECSRPRRGRTTRYAAHEPRNQANLPIGYDGAGAGSR